MLQPDWPRAPNWDQVLHTKAQFTSLNHEWESYMATLLDSMCRRDLGKELGKAKMETQLQRQVLTIFLIIKYFFKWLHLVH
jgi:hypothetical protein